MINVEKLAAKFLFNISFFYFQKKNMKKGWD